MIANKLIEFFKTLSGSEIQDGRLRASVKELSDAITASQCDSIMESCKHARKNTSNAEQKQLVL